jgi:hypothetical protein
VKGDVLMEKMTPSLEEPKMEETAPGTRENMPGNEKVSLR